MSPVISSTIDETFSDGAKFDPVEYPRGEKSVFDVKGEFLKMGDLKIDLGKLGLGFCKMGLIE